jgi:hypothetical protein
VRLTLEKARVRVRQHVRVNEAVASKTGVFASTFVIVSEADYPRSGIFVTKNEDVRDLCWAISDLECAARRRRRISNTTVLGSFPAPHAYLIFLIAPYSLTSFSMSSYVHGKTSHKKPL